MKKLFTLLFSFTFFLSQAQTLVLWDFEGSNPAASTVPANGSATSVETSGSSQVISYFGGFNSASAISTVGFPTNATIDLNKYFQFRVTPNSGFIVNISEITFQIRNSTTGPTAWILRSSVDNFATNIATSSALITTTFAQNTSGSLASNTNLQGVGSGIIFRLYGVSATNTSGNIRVDNLTILGTITAGSSSPLVTVSKPSIALGNTTIGTPSATQTYNVSGLNLTDNITITAPSDFEISTSMSSGFGSSLTLPQTSGSVPISPIYVRLTGASIGSFTGDIAHVSSGAISKNVALTGSVTAIVPTINVTSSSLSALSTTEGVASATLNYAVTGSFLTSDITINAPSGFEISISSGSGFSPSLMLSQVSGNVSAITIYIRLNGITQGSYNGNITHTSAGATSKNVAVLGIVNPVFTGQNYLHLKGNFHAHTAYSDGNKDASTSSVSTPGQSYAYARSSMNFDFLGISEHNHATAGMNKPDYALGVQQAAAESTLTFSSIYGIEYGVINNGGHMLVYGINELIGWEPGNYDIFNSKFDYANLYTIINNRPGSWASLAHPSSGDYTGLFSSQPYSSTADDAIAGCAVRSGSAFSTTENYMDAPATDYETEYNQVLAKGYHVAPFIDHDNHNTTFGRTVKGRTVVLAQSNTPANILAGVKARRVYATDDWNEKIDFTLNGLIMGSVGFVSGNPSITINITDADNEVPSKIELFYGVPESNVNATLLTSSTNSNILNYTHVSALNTTFYYYVKVTQPDGDLLWTAPIWATKTSNTLPIELVDFKAELQEKSKSVAVTWRAEQTGAAEYEVERSADGKTYETIGKVKGETKGGAYDYAFMDSKPVEGYSYYRLRQIDEDGTFKFSKIVSIYFKPKYLILKNISPNPTPDVVNVLFDSEKETNEYAYFIYDEEGRAILYKKINVTEGENNIKIDVSKLPNGLYFLNIGKRDDRIIQTRFVKY
jgi:Secretion system C-terminal sorting domain